MTTSSVLTSTVQASSSVRTRRSAPVRRPVGTRPAAGTVDYGQCGPGVSRTEHEQPSRMSVGQMLAVAVTTAVLSLGLIGVANLRADTNDVQSPTSTSIVQGELGAAGAR